MGCVNQGVPIKKAKVQKYQQTQPSIVTKNQVISLNIPHQIISHQACGYNFENSFNIITHENINPQTYHQTLQQIQNEYNNLYEKCKYYYQEHNIDTSYQYLLMIQNLLNENKENQQIYSKLKEKERKNIKFIQQIRQQYSDVINYDKQIIRGGWVQKSNRKGVKVSVRRQQQLIGVLVESIIDLPFEMLISVLVQMDLYKDFMPFVSVSRQQKIVSRNCRIGYTQNEFPFFSTREAFFQGVGYTRLHTNNRLFFYSRSITNRPDLQQKLQYKCNINPDYVQLQYKYLVLQYQPISKGKGLAILAVGADSKKGYLPIWLEEFLSKQFGERFFQNIMKAGRKFKNSNWQKNTKANPEIFQFFKNQIDKQLQHIGQNKGNFLSTNTNL